MWYTNVVTITATDFRKNVFQLLESALNGEVVDVCHKGRTVRLSPADQPSKLSRLKKRNILAGTPNEIDDALEAINNQTRKDWERKWQSS